MAGRHLTQCLCHACSLLSLYDPSLLCRRDPSQAVSSRGSIPLSLSSRHARRPGAHMHMSCRGEGRIACASLPPSRRHDPAKRVRLSPSNPPPSGAPPAHACACTRRRCVHAASRPRCSWDEATARRGHRPRVRPSRLPTAPAHPSRPLPLVASASRHCQLSDAEQRDWEARRKGAEERGRRGRCDADAAACSHLPRLPSPPALTPPPAPAAARARERQRSRRAVGTAHSCRRR